MTQYVSKRRLYPIKVKVYRCFRRFRRV